MATLKILAIATCFLWNSITCSSQQFSSLLKTVVDDEKSLANNIQPDSQISGTNGYCFDVKHGNFTDGNGVMAWICKNGASSNQLWTFHSDGTLRCNNKCLTATGSTQGSKLVIFDCDSAPKNATLWQLQDDGEIINTPTGLVATAITGVLATDLTLEISISSSFQTWRVGNDTQPRLATITGMQGLCLEAADDEVSLQSCDTNNVGQQWFIYPDGTIRTREDSNGCLAFQNLISTRVFVLTCGFGPSSERWLFTSRRTLFNERTNLVIDVKQTNTGVKEIVVKSSAGSASQLWEISQL